jgi:hypothetical protein
MSSSTTGGQLEEKFGTGAMNDCTPDRVCEFDGKSDRCESCPQEISKSKFATFQSSETTPTFFLCTVLADLVVDAGYTQRSLLST